MLELPAVQRFFDDAQIQGVHLVTIVPSADADGVRRTVDAAGYRFPVLVDPEGATASEYRVAGTSQTVVLVGGQAKARVVGSAADRSILDALRAATDVAEVPTAGTGWRTRSSTSHEEDGRYVARLDGKVLTSQPVNRGRWTTWPDGIYLHGATGDVLLVSTARGAPSEAGSLAVDLAVRLWKHYVAAVCPPSARVTVANVRSMGAFAERMLRSSVFAGWPEAEIVAQIPSCTADVEGTTYVAPDEARQVHRVLWVVPADTIVCEMLQRWRGSTKGERRPVGPDLRNHMDAVRALLRDEGRAVEAPLE